MNGKGIDFNNPKPLYEQIENDIKEKIERGELKPGQQIASQHDMAKEYNVSLITVKKALSDLVADGTLFTRQGKGTFVAEPFMKKVDLTAHKTIGVVLRDLKHPFFSLIIHSIEERASELGYNLLLSSSSNNLEKEEAQINRFRDLNVDGIIIASLSLQYRATDYIQKLHNENFPYIMVSYIHDPDYWYVGSDHEYGGYVATEQLIKLGYKNIGYLSAGKGNLLSEVRKNGYYRALVENDILFDAKLVFYLGKEDYEQSVDRRLQGYEFGKIFKDLNRKPDALYVYSDLIALGFQQAMMEEGFKIPDDVALIGNDDLQVASFASVPLTTIHQPYDKIGRLAVEIIQKRIEQKDIGNRTILKPSLIIRESCGAKKRSNSLAG
jgi:GntR family transcriptional regulator, arabinose operon transcriptional repressor